MHVYFFQIKCDGKLVDVSERLAWRIWRMNHQCESLKTMLQIHSVCAELSDQIAETNLIMSHSTVKLGSFGFTSELFLLKLWPYFLTFAIVHIMVPQESPQASPGRWHIQIGDGKCWQHKHKLNGKEKNDKSCLRQLQWEVNEKHVEWK